MPQLEFGNPLILSQVFWLLVIFGALYVIVSKIALPPVASVLEERAAKIAAELDRARALKEEADAAMAEAEKAQAKARAEAQAAIRAAIERAKAEAAKAEAEQAARLARQIAEAEARIAEARAKAEAAIGEVAVEAAQAATARLIGVTPDLARVQAAISEVGRG
ncbi:F0F1 ATP synthase subunit B family protein [Elioraea thermophila]|uniref:F0F1 ATP synthase subunit B family protein n=1 Tax=Elioraea thermophila TaxID=2185104 RepID=UPI000DF24963|nr:F0F1 ATP synthase subunit B' [Elioraea thermophila]